MFKIFSKSKSSAFDFSQLGTDLHSHLLPGIDDGSPDETTSLELIRGMRELGYSKLITTPHIMWDMYRNNNDVINEKLAALQSKLASEKINVELKAAAEYFLDDHVAGLVKESQPLLTISGNMVLVEFSMAHASMSLKDILFDMQMQGYQPVIAHPERYIYLEHAKEFYTELKDIGCLFQLNILSLGNGYGKSVQELANYLVKKEFYDLAGTDLHHHRHLESLQNPALAVPLQRLVDSGKIRNREL
jgi:tyrosine-protein phosphatase YwqE